MIGLRQILERIDRLDALEQGLAKETAAQTTSVWWAAVSLEQKQYIAALCKGQAALNEARATLTKAAQKLAGHPPPDPVTAPAKSKT
jgi:hypothetical protein